MNTTVAEGRALAEGIVSSLPPRLLVEVLVCPPFTALSAVAQALQGTPVGLGGQNMYFRESGAFTGEISPAMLLDCGCRFVILGHSERRRQMGEGSDLVNKKVLLALKVGLVPIVCLGETGPERASGMTETVITEQLRTSLAGLSREQWKDVILAYEPVWAIGTGDVATPEQAEAVHHQLRGLIPFDMGADVSILYGGSVAPDNAEALLAEPDIDGALVGGASLKVTSFVEIIQAAGRP